MALRCLAYLLASSLLLVIASGEDCMEIPFECSGDGPDTGPPDVQPVGGGDVVFVIDGSTSIGEKSFNIGKNWVTDYISKFNIGPLATRVGVITFGTNVTVRLPLEDSGLIGLDQTVERIGAIQLPGGGTKTGQGVKVMTDLFRNQGRLDVDGIKSVGFILTDGRSQDPPEEYASMARELGIVLYAIGIGEEINEEELLSIAGSKDRVFLIDSYEQLLENLNLFPQVIDSPPPPPRASNCVQLECMLDEEGVPTMRVLVPNSLNSCCSGRIGSCDHITYEPSDKAGYVKRDVKAGECNTKFIVAADDLEYSNILNLYEESDNGAVVRDETEWRLKCKYPRAQLKTTVYDTSRKVRNVTNDGFIPMELEIYDPSYAQLVPRPAIFKLKDRVYVQASMPTHEELELFPLKCWTTNGADPTGSPSKMLIENGCEAEGTLTRELETSPVHSRFSFEAFRFKDVGTCKVYVHCDLLICAAGDAGSRCSQGCIKRAKRSVDEGSFISTQRVMVGPIIVGDMLQDSPSSYIDGVTRMTRLKDVGKKLAAMMRNMRRSRMTRLSRA